uniref:RNA 3'-terminal phosphate cyclase n=1 Tax=Cyprinus carpio TaxID=7962 RepID=A0A8C2AUV9_CYPCA
MAATTFEMDGSVMEGGGQILRVSAALSCIQGASIKINKIRAGRSTPGLRPQHLSGLELVRDMCSGNLEGATVGSTEITHTPGKIKGGNHIADTHTAGSVGLLMQISLPCALFAQGPSELCLKGGTNAEMAPQIDYTLKVFKPIAERFGVQFVCDLKMRGYYPKGGGEVVLKVNPVKELSPINLTERGNITKIYVFVFNFVLQFFFSVQHNKNVFVWKVIIRFFSQLIIFMALANGTSRMRTGPITLHTQTAIHVAEQLTNAKFVIHKSEDEHAKDTYIIECQGVGATNPNL